MENDARVLRKVGFSGLFVLIAIMSLAARLQAKIKESLGNETEVGISIENNGCGGKANISVISAKFHDLTKIQRHRIIQDSIGAEIRTELHAVSILAKTPLEIGNQ